MNTSSKLIAIAIIGVLILAGLPTLQSEETEEEPEYYEVTRYNMRGVTYTEETIKVSMEDAEEIKKTFEGIDSSLSEDKIDRKGNVLLEYGLIENDYSNQYFLKLKKSLNVLNFFDKYEPFETRGILLSTVIGTFGLSFINSINFFVFAPLFFSITKGIDLEINPDLSSSHVVQFDGWVRIFLFMAGGQILIMPFFSPSGYINAGVIFGTITY